MVKKIFMIVLGVIFINNVFAKENVSYAPNTVNYYLNIGDKYEEKIVFAFSSDAYSIADDDSSDIPPLEYILLYEKQYPLVSNLNVEYEKDIKKRDDMILVTLEYTYSLDEFKNATFLNNCFENYKIEETDDGVNYSLNGSFYCLHGKTFYINVTSDQSIVDSNGVKKSNEYHWIINNNSVDIGFKLKDEVINIDNESNKQNDSSKQLIIIFIVGIVLLLFILTKSVKVKK